MFGCDYLRHAKLRTDWLSLGLSKAVLAKALDRNA
jgi:hypothetical protein